MITSLPSKEVPLTVPVSLCALAFFAIAVRWDGKDVESQCMTNIDNDKLLQFVSKEVCYQSESFKQFVKDKKYYLQK